MTDELARRGFCVSHKHVERLMAAHSPYAKDGRARRSVRRSSDASPPQLSDLVKRDFSVGAPGERSCGDVTYVWPTSKTSVLAASSVRRGRHMRTELVVSATRRTGSSLDNAAAESRVGRLQARAREPLSFRLEGRSSPGNAVRLHSSLGAVPPIEWELRHYRSMTAEGAEAA